MEYFDESSKKSFCCFQSLKMKATFKSTKDDFIQNPFSYNQRRGENKMKLIFIGPARPVADDFQRKETFWYRF
jgi:hypothetical protein